MNSSPYERWKKSAKLELFIINRNGLLKCSFEGRSCSSHSRGSKLARFENESSIKSLRNYAGKKQHVFVGLDCFVDMDINVEVVFISKFLFVL